MKLLQVTEQNKAYYSADYTKGFNVGAKAQYEEDKKEVERRCGINTCTQSEHNNQLPVNESRSLCKLRHKNGNCLCVGGFCTAVNDEICKAIRMSYEKGYIDGKMDDNWEEPAINPCRGCEDYDGKGGCISKGGCGAKMKGKE